MKIAPNAALISALSRLEEAKPNKDAGQSFRQSGNFGDGAEGGRNAITTRSPDSAQKLTAPGSAEFQALSNNRNGSERLYHREAVDPNRRATPPGLGRIIDLSV